MLHVSQITWRYAKRLHPPRQHMYERSGNLNHSTEVWNMGPHPLSLPTFIYTPCNVITVGHIYFNRWVAKYTMLHRCYLITFFVLGTICQHTTYLSPVRRQVITWTNTDLLLGRWVNTGPGLHHTYANKYPKCYSSSIYFSNRLTRIVDFS